MKRINNKGFAISTFLYSLIVMIFLIVLASLSMLGTARNNTKNLTDDLKKELIDRYDGKKPVCRRVALDHNCPFSSDPNADIGGVFCSKCDNTDVWIVYKGRRQGACASDGYQAGQPIKMGQRAKVPGQLSPGDAFICDVNGDGNYSSNQRDDGLRNQLELFYYLTDLDTNPDYAVLIFFANVEGGEFTTSSNKIGHNYSDTTTDYVGPTIAINELPTTSQWKNVKLYREFRTIKDESGEDRVLNYSYAGRAARLPTYQEIKAACPSLVTYDASTTADPTPQGTANGQCEYLMEYTPYDNGTWQTTTKGYWLETVSSASASQYKHIILDGVSHNVYPLVNNGVNTNQRFGVRPVIEVPKHLIDYQ